MDINVKGIGADGYVYLSRGSSLEVALAFEYKGRPQTATLELVMKQGLFGTEYLCGVPTVDVKGATVWELRTGNPSYIVPVGVKDGSQDVRMHITTEDGKEKYSDWLTDCIWIS